MNFYKAYQEFVENCAGQDVLRVPERLNGMLVEEIPRLMGGPQQFKEVWLPESVQRIDSYAFDEWSELCEIHLPQEMEYIGAYAFSETQLRELRLPDGIKYLGNSMCYRCHLLESVYLGDGLETIGIGTFWDCTALRQIVIPATVRRIMDSAFQDCQNLAWLRFEGRVEAIAPNAFADCGNLVLVESLQIEQKVEEISHTDAMMESFQMTERPKKKKNKQTFMSLFHLHVIPVLPNLIDADITSLEYAEAEYRAANYRQALGNLPKTESKEKSVQERIVSLLDVAVQAKCLGQYRTALELCEQALALKPENGVAFYNLAKLLYLVGQSTAVLKALAFAKLNVYQAHNTKLYGLAGHVYLDTDIKRQKTYIGEILAYRSWAAGHRGEKPVTGYELLCEIEGKKRLEERAVEDNIPEAEILLRQQLTQNAIDRRIRQRMRNAKEFNDMVREIARVIYLDNTSLNNEIGKFDDDPCYVYCFEKLSAHGKGFNDTMYATLLESRADALEKLGRIEEAEAVSASPQGLDLNYARVGHSLRHSVTEREMTQLQLKLADVAKRENVDSDSGVENKSTFTKRGRETCSKNETRQIFWLPDKIMPQGKLLNPDEIWLPGTDGKYTIVTPLGELSVKALKKEEFLQRLDCMLCLDLARIWVRSFFEQEQRRVAYLPATETLQSLWELDSFGNIPRESTGEFRLDDMEVEQDEQ